MRSPLLDRPGAVGDVVARHYGEPLKEQRLLAAGRALVDCSDWSVLRLSGPDRLSWLDAISSQFLAVTPAGETREALILDPQGRVDHRFLLVDDGESSWLLTEPGSAESLEAWLVRMRFRHEVTISDVSDDWAVVAAVSGPDTDNTQIGFPSMADSPVRWVDSWPTLQLGGAAYSAVPHPADGFQVTFWLVARDRFGPDIFPEWAGSDALEALWIRAGRPSFRGEVDDKTLPHEVDWLRTAVHLDKGCYRGQETVAKVHNLGHPPRRLTLLHLDGSGSELPSHGAEVFAGDRVVGQVSRSAHHFEWGPIALALLKRTLDPEVDLVVAGPDGKIPARQEVLVLPEAGRPEERPSGRGSLLPRIRLERMSGTLILLRHGQSVWNEKNLFTGWVDVRLSDQGAKEASRAGELIRESGLLPDVLHTSLLSRAIQTAHLALDAADRLWIPVRRTWRLNERHYGALQGKDKAETLAEFGEEQFQLWRRSFDVPPPPIERGSEFSQETDPRYADIAGFVPKTESLKLVIDRMMPYWIADIKPEVMGGKTVLVVAHGNSLRGLVKHLEGMSDEDVVELNIPTGIPLVYELGQRGKPKEKGRYLDPAAAEAGAKAVAAQGVKKRR